MIPFRLLAQVRTPDGSLLTLHEHDGEHYMKLNGRQLMSTTSTTSEELLADYGCDRVPRTGPARVLIGGLGLGFTLKRVLHLLGPGAEVHVAELLPEVVAWTKHHLMKVNGKLLRDKRVTILTEDVFDVIRRSAKEPYDAILLDVDNGPTSFVQAGNKRIYRRGGHAAVRRALKMKGTVAYWSATEEPEFIGQLMRAGFRATVFEAKAHERAKRAAHRIYVAVRWEAVHGQRDEDPPKPQRRGPVPRTREK